MENVYIKAMEIGFDNPEGRIKLDFIQKYGNIPMDRVCGLD